jgi:hypothetical protein
MSRSGERIDHIIVLDERHLKPVVDEYSFQYFNTVRPHQAIGQRVPVAAPTTKFAEGGTVRSLRVLAGLHHDYQVAA